MNRVKNSFDGSSRSREWIPIRAIIIWLYSNTLNFDFFSLIFFCGLSLEMFEVLKIESDFSFKFPTNTNWRPHRSRSFIENWIYRKVADLLLKIKLAIFCLHNCSLSAHNSFVNNMPGNLPSGHPDMLWYFDKKKPLCWYTFVSTFLMGV